MRLKETVPLNPPKSTKHVTTCSSLCGEPPSRCPCSLYSREHGCSEDGADQHQSTEGEHRRKCLEVREWERENSPSRVVRRSRPCCIHSWWRRDGRVVWERIVWKRHIYVLNETGRITAPSLAWWISDRPFCGCFSPNDPLPRCAMSEWLRRVALDNGWRRWRLYSSWSC